MLTKMQTAGVYIFFLNDPPPLLEIIFPSIEMNLHTQEHLRNIAMVILGRSHLHPLSPRRDLFVLGGGGREGGA